METLIDDGDSKNLQASQMMCDPSKVFRAGTRIASSHQSRGWLSSVQQHRQACSHPSHFQWLRSAELWKRGKWRNVIRRRSAQPHAGKLMKQDPSIIKMDGGMNPESIPTRKLNRASNPGFHGDGFVTVPDPCTHAERRLSLSMDTEKTRVTINTSWHAWMTEREIREI